MFDVITNKYRIIPLTQGLTAINNFIINNNLTNFNDNLNVNNIISKNDFYQRYCNSHIVFNVIQIKNLQILH